MEITPRSFGEILTDGMTLLARVWRGLLAPAMGGFLPLGALTLLTFQWTGANDFLRLIFDDPQTLEAMTPEEFAAAAAPFLEAVVVALALQLVATGFVNVATHRLVGAELAGEPITGGAAARFALSRLTILMAAGLMATIGVAMGAVIFVVPGVWLAISWIIVPQVITFEEEGALGSLTRSFRLVKGRWWGTLGFMLLVGLLGITAGQLIQLVAIPLVSAGDVPAGLGLAFVLGMVIQGLIVAGIAVMTTVWYVDLRARKETLVSESLG